MGMISCKCPNCGADIQLDETREFGFCSFCGTKVMQDKVVVEHRGSVKVDNSEYVQKFLQNARRAKQKEDWEEVEKYYNLVEQNDPTNIEAIFYSSYARVKLALLEAEAYQKRKSVFNVLIKGVSIIDDNYDYTSEEHKKLLFEIIDDIKGLEKGAIVPTTHLADYVAKNGYGNVVDRNQVVENDPLKFTYHLIDEVIEAFRESINNIIIEQCKDLSEGEISEKAYETLKNDYPDFALYYFSEYIKKKTDSPVGYLGKAVATLALDKYRSCVDEVVAASKYSVNENDKKDVDCLIGMSASSKQRTLLINAAAFENYDAVEYLVDLGSEIDAKDAEDKTALWYVCSVKGDKYEDLVAERKIAKLLLDKGANADIISKGGVALYNKKTDYEIAKMMLAKYPNLTKGESAGTKSGCYVATAVYGSYDCPQVWTLRRYRDYTLAETWYGRAFIHTYYAISPTLVKWFGKTKWFKNMWKPRLDKMVIKLQKSGVESTPYEDRKW